MGTIGTAPGAAAQVTVSGLTEQTVAEGKQVTIRNGPELVKKLTGRYYTDAHILTVSGEVGSYLRLGPESNLTLKDSLSQLPGDDFAGTSCGNIYSKGSTSHWTVTYTVKKACTLRAYITAVQHNLTVSGTAGITHKTAGTWQQVQAKPGDTVTVQCGDGWISMMLVCLMP